MNRFWIFLIILAVIILLGGAAYELFNSVSGGNVEFVKQVEPIQRNLGEDVVLQFDAMSKDIQVKDDDLDNK